MIDIKDLSISFGDKEVIHSQSISFEEGKTHGIIGLNGAGKTTFFNLLSHFLQADKGEILRDGKPLTRNDVGYLETNNFFYSNITGREYLNIFSSSNSQFDLEKINELLQLPLDEIVETYSTGMKKKVAILAVLKQDKPIYILDEPFNGLDLETNRVLELAIENLKKRGKTIFISSHILSPLIHNCDHIHLLQSGVFRKTYDKNNFHEVETELFSEFNEKAKGIVSNAL